MDSDSSSDDEDKKDHKSDSSLSEDDAEEKDDDDDDGDDDSDHWDDSDSDRNPFAKGSDSDDGILHCYILKTFFLFHFFAVMWNLHKFFELHNGFATLNLQ